MSEFLLLTAISSLKAFLAFEKQYRKGRVFVESEKEYLESALDVLIRIQKRTVGIFGEG